MFKRVRWMSVGLTAGVGASVWANRKVKKAAARLTPEAVGREASDRARRLGRDVLDSLGEGRDAMARREAELRRRPPGDPSATAAGPDRPRRPGRPLNPRQ